MIPLRFFVFGTELSKYPSNIAGLAWRDGIQFMLLLHVIKYTLLNPRTSLFSSHLQSNSQTNSTKNHSLSLFFPCFPLFSSVSSTFSRHKNGGSHTVCVQIYNAIQERKARAYSFMALWLSFLLIHETSRWFRQISNLCFLSVWIRICTFFFFLFFFF